jgi:hypothetical protein
MGLPRLIGKALNTRTIYLLRPDSMAGLVLWIPSRRRKGVRDYRLSRERQFQEFSDKLIKEIGRCDRITFVNVKIRQVCDKCILYSLGGESVNNVLGLKCQPCASLHRSRRHERERAGGIYLFFTLSICEHYLYR